MSANAIYLHSGGHLVPLDLDDTALLPSFQANDRTKPSTLQSDYSPEFSVPGTAKNHRLLQHAAASQPAQGSAYVRVPAVLTSGGVETVPLALLSKFLVHLAQIVRRVVAWEYEKATATRYTADWWACCSGSSITKATAQNQV